MQPAHARGSTCTTRDGRAACDGRGCRRTRRRPRGRQREACIRHPRMERPAPGRPRTHPAETRRPDRSRRRNARAARNAEPGKSIHVSRAIEVGASVEYVRYMAGWATKITGQTLDVSIPFPPGARYTAYTRKEPVGVVAAIVPWNFPLMIAVWKLIPALAAGCTIVLKPSPETPLTALRLARTRGRRAARRVQRRHRRPRVRRRARATRRSRRSRSRKPTATGKLVGAAAVQNMTRFSLDRRQEPDRDARRRRRRAGARRRRRRRVLQPGAGVRGRIAHLCAPQQVQAARGRPRGRRAVDEARRRPRHDRADQPAGLRAPSRQGRPAHRRRAPRPHVPRGRHAGRRPARLLREAGGDRRSASGQRDRARRSVWPGDRRRAVRRRGRCGASRERVAVRPCREPLEQRPDARDEPRAADRGRHRG